MPEKLIIAIIEAESSGVYYRISGQGAIGLMGVKPQAAREFYKAQYRKHSNEYMYICSKAPDEFFRVHLKDQKVNIQIGTWYFMERCMRKAKGNWILALDYYNQGENHRSKFNHNYVNKVMIRMADFN